MKEKIFWILTWIFLLIMFYIAATVCFSIEGFQWLATIYIITLGALLVALGDRIIFEK